LVLRTPVWIDSGVLWLNPQVALILFLAAVFVLHILHRSS